MQSREYNSKINDPIWPVYKLVRVFIYVHLSCKFHKVLIKTKQVVVMTKSIRGFCSNQGNVTCKINDPIWPDLDLVQDFIDAHLICRFQEDLIKTDVILRLMTWSTQFRTLMRVHPCPTYLQVSETSDENWTSYADEKIKQRLFQQSRGRN